ncbi:hypothetical protein Ddye_010856, partial [Dipteronia dyeriana]
DILVRHNLDVMHVEKNICVNIISTLLNVKGKSNDGLNSRRDLESMCLRKELHPESRGNIFYLPTASHTLLKGEKQIFYRRLANMKLPDGYGSNIETRVSVKDCKIFGIKSHDFHLLMQQFLSIALRGLLPKGPRITIFLLCSFFNELCNRVVDIIELKIWRRMWLTLCMSERFFPQSFFDIMVHLTIHLG